MAHAGLGTVVLDQYIKTPNQLIGGNGSVGTNHYDILLLGVAGAVFR